MSELVSVVIPVYNEAVNIPILYGQLNAVAQQMSAPCEFVFVDDGSTDGTWEQLVALRREDERLTAIRFTRNFGQTAAMACGIDAARGDRIVTMDGDLQNDPADIPTLLAKMAEGYDIVCGWRYRRQDSLWARKVPSMVANWLIGGLTGVRLHDYGCSLKAYRAEAIKRTPLYAEFHRFIPALATLTGVQIAELKVKHRPRRYGQSKYDLWRTWKVAFDMVTVSVLIKFASKPLRFFGFLALCSAAVASLCVVRAWHWYVGPYNWIPQVLPGVAVLGIWLAGHLLIVGLIAELCLATSHARPERCVAVQWS